MKDLTITLQQKLDKRFFMKILHPDMWTLFLQMGSHNASKRIFMTMLKKKRLTTF